MRKFTERKIMAFEMHLMEEEKSAATIQKYIRDVRSFWQWLKKNGFEKSDVLEYKKFLCKKYAPASVNSALSSINCFFSFQGWFELRVKSLKIQKTIFRDSGKSLTKAEYGRLLSAAMQLNDRRTYFLMQTICSTGIRVSELRYITTQAVSDGVAEIRCKGKRRCVFLPNQLCKLLKQYIKENRIKDGAVFVTKHGNPLDRSNVWDSMKKLCKAAHVSEEKVFPHNLRHLFACTYYSQRKDIVRLADLLGHSNVNTTRIYTMETGEVHRKQIQELGLLRC
ncbi:MAG: integrase [Ruminococcaceae bacterium]|nr:integrase [Oscillospiraceae bacterium]